MLGVPLLAFPLGLKGAVSVLVLPIIVSNIAQSFAAGLFRPVARRFWPLLVALFCVTAISTRGFSLLPERALFGAVGAALIVFPIAACIPVLFGMSLGSKVRMRTSDQVFSRLVFTTYLLTGISFLVRATKTI